MDKEHYRPSEVDFYVGDTETAPVSVEQILLQMPYPKTYGRRTGNRRFITDPSVGGR